MYSAKKIALLFLSWRLFLLIPLYIGYVFLTYRLNFPYTNIWYFIKPYDPVSNFLIFPWANFDGIHYLSIAGDGYNISNSRFFPIFPLIINFFSNILGGGKTYGTLQFFVALALSNAFFLSSLFIFYKLIRLDFSEKIAFRSIFFMLVFPTSFYFASIYSESIFLLLSLLCFYFARKGNWIIASICGMALTATRIIGIGILPALLYEFSNKKKEKFYKSIPLYFIPLGLISYMVFNFVKFGNMFSFLQNQGSLANGRNIGTIVLPLQTIFRYLRILTTVPSSQYEWWVASLEVLVFILTSFLLYIAFVKKIHFSYIIYSLICFIMPILSGTFSGIPRYVLILFPIFIALSFLQNKFLIFVYTLISTILLFVLTMLFARGYFIA